MESVYGRNIHEALPKAMSLLCLKGYIKGRRAYVGPISISVANPSERLSYGTTSDLNPFTALFTALWTLGGRADVEFPSKFDGYRPESSDDGIVIPGAYGIRMRDHFWVAEDAETGLSLGRIDQLKSVALMLQKDPGGCTPVISLWDTGVDLGLSNEITPAATHLYLNLDNDQRLDMMVVCRDADMLNLRMDFVVFSMIHEYLAWASSIPLGRTLFVINSLSVDVGVINRPLWRLPSDNPYKSIEIYPLVSLDPEAWLGELSMFLDEGPVLGMREPFFRHVASPMWQAWKVYRGTSDSAIGPEGADRALEIVTRVRADDWRAAATDWLLRKIDE